MNVILVATVLIVLVILTGAGNLFSSYVQFHDFKASQQKQGQLVEQRLCSTLDKLGALKPPPGNPHANPSRGYDQQLHATLAQLGTDLRCPPHE